MVRGMQEEDAAGHPRMLAYLKHYTAYSVENNRGHDDYAISQFDFYDTYLSQYKIAMVDGGASGVMCSYNAENGHPSCANGFVLNDVMRTQWNRPDSVVMTGMLLACSRPSLSGGDSFFTMHVCQQTVVSLVICSVLLSMLRPQLMRQRGQLTMALISKQGPTCGVLTAG